MDLMVILLCCVDVKCHRMAGFGNCNVHSLGSVSTELVCQLVTSFKLQKRT
jgi:hypothetical protein